MIHPIKHFLVITKHKNIVMKYCFKMGLYRQGICHDLSKYSPTEFWISSKYFMGDHSPTLAERKAKGYSEVWLHHKGRNKHHYEYWYDYSFETKKNEPVKIPIRYVKEMVCDRIAACKVYLGKDYTKDAALNYYNRTTDKEFMHPDTAKLLGSWLELIAKLGENEAIKQIKQVKEYWK